VEQRFEHAHIKHVAVSGSTQACRRLLQVIRTSPRVSEASVYQHTTTVDFPLLTRCPHETMAISKICIVLLTNLFGLAAEDA
jgi:hypothetical protein